MSNQENKDTEQVTPKPKILGGGFGEKSSTESWSSRTPLKPLGRQRTSETVSTPDSDTPMDDGSTKTPPSTNVVKLNATPKKTPTSITTIATTTTTTTSKALVEAGQLLSDTLVPIVDRIVNEEQVGVDEWRSGAKALALGNTATKMGQFRMAWYAHMHYDENWEYQAERIEDIKERLSYEEIAPHFGVEPNTIKNWVTTVNAMSEELEGLCDGKILTASHVQSLCSYSMPNEARLTIARAIIDRNTEYLNDPIHHERCTTSDAKKMARAESIRWMGEPDKEQPIASSIVKGGQVMLSFGPEMTLNDILEAVSNKVAAALQQLGQQNSDREVIGLTVYITPEISLGA